MVLRPQVGKGARGAKLLRAVPEHCSLWYPTTTHAGPRHPCGMKHERRQTVPVPYGGAIEGSHKGLYMWSWCWAAGLPEGAGTRVKCLCQGQPDWEVSSE